MRTLPNAVLALALAVAFTAPAPARAGAGSPGARPVLGWISDDYAKALTQARARKLPIIIESWAPW